MKQIDCLVVGAGIAGLSAAARIAAHRSVIVCEAEGAVGIHASGRSAAFAHFDMESAIVRALTAASLPLLQELGAKPHPALFVALDGQLEKLDQLETNYRKWAPGIERLDPVQACELVPVLKQDSEGIVGALLDSDGRKLDAHALLEGHRKALRVSGGELTVGAPVKAIRRNSDRWIVDTPGQSYSAKVIVNAAGAWADHVASLAGVEPVGIQPLRRTVITFDVPADMDVSRWPFTKTVGTGFYIEPEGSGRLLACPMDEHPSDPCDSQPEEEDIALTAWRVEQATTLEIKRIASKWAGLRSFAPDREPVVGFDPDASGFFWLAGQGGFGLQTSPAMALTAEALICQLGWPEELRAVSVAPAQLSPARLRS